MVLPAVPARVAHGLRRLAWGRGISALGDGLWFTIWALYFTRVVGLSAPTVGIGMGAAGAVGLLAAVPLGSLADRFDPRRILVTVIAIRAAAMAAHLLVHDTVTFLAVTVAFVGLTNGANAVRTALIAGLVDDNTVRMTALAQQRVAQHVGYALGAGVGAAVLALDRPAVYSAAVVTNALSFVVLAFVTATVPPPNGSANGSARTASASPSRRSSARVALRDRPYLAVMACTAVLALCWAMLSTGLPLWISRWTRLPLALGGIVVVISSVGIAALQVFVTRFARTTRQAARTAVLSGGFLAGSCVLLATTGGGAGVVATLVVLGAAVLHVCGELGYVAANWGLSVALMREDAHGAYQGVSETATATVQMFAPAVFSLAVGTVGAGGWLLVAAVFLAATAPVPALTRWAERTR